MGVNFIVLLHTFFMLYVIAVPFFSVSVDTLYLHVWLLLLMLLHWITNNDVCVLTELEQYLYPTKERRELFTNRLIGSVYRIDNQQLRELTLLLWLFTIYKYVHLVTI